MSVIARRIDGLSGYVPRIRSFEAATCPGEFICAERPLRSDVRIDLRASTAPENGVLEPRIADLRLIAHMQMQAKCPPAKAPAAPTT